MAQTKTGDWDRFQVRNLGLAVQRRMAARFRGNAESIRRDSLETVTRVLGIRQREWRESELHALNDLALVLALIPDLDRWTDSEKETLVRIIRAKASADEGRYLKLLQQHSRLRVNLIKLGSQA
jgi:hypothetical protein